MISDCLSHQVRQASKAAVAGVPQLRPTGRVIEMVVTSGGSGYNDTSPPLVSITAPQGGSSSTPEDGRYKDPTLLKLEPWRRGRRAAQARAIVRDGSVVAFVLTDPGAGYKGTDRVQVVVAPPPRALTGVVAGAKGKVRVSAVDCSRLWFDCMPIVVTGAEGPDCGILDEYEPGLRLIAHLR